MSGNRHDQWLRFCGTYEPLLAATGIPAAITHGEHRWRDLIRDGSAAGCGVMASLTDLSSPQWTALVEFAAVFFHEFESYAPLDLFPAIRQEAERRAQEYPPALPPDRNDVDPNVWYMVELLCPKKPKE